MWCLLTGMAAWRSATSTATASRIWRWLARIRLRSWVDHRQIQFSIFIEVRCAASENTSSGSGNKANWLRDEHDATLAQQDRNLIRASHRQIRLAVAVEVADRQAAIPDGVTTNNVLGCELVLMSGEIVRLGGSHLDSAGYDLLGLVTGSEGLLGVVTEVTVRILKKPESARAALIGFATSEDGGECVARIIGAGIIPGGMEMMDGPAIHAAEEFVHAGYPLDVEALLIVELDGPRAEVDHLLDRVQEIARQCRAVTCRASNSEEERLLFWAGRKAAFPAVGRISPDYYCMDGTIPRAKLPFVLQRMREMSKKYGLRVANVFHAGDGNLHPLILYDSNKPDELDRAEQFGAEILKLCVEVGGVLTGEHGVGVEKRDLMPVMFSEIDLAAQQRVKCAFDAKGLLNPGKVFPVLHRCAELGRIHISGGKLPFPDIPRF